MDRYRSRRFRNTLYLGLSGLAAAIGLGLLALILGALLWNGLQGLDISVFTEPTPPPPGDAGGGLSNAIIGSLIMTVLAMLVGTPLGILAGTYMAEYGRAPGQDDEGAIGGAAADIKRAVDDHPISLPGVRGSSA